MGVLSLGWGGGGNGAETKVIREAKGAADGRHAADNVSPIDGTAVPGIGRSVGGFNENGVSTPATVSYTQPTLPTKRTV